MTAYGRIDGKDGRKRFASGEILSSKGEIMATATGVYVSVDIVDTNADWKDAQLGVGVGADDPKEL